MKIHDSTTTKNHSFKNVGQTNPKKDNSILSVWHIKNPSFYLYQIKYIFMNTSTIIVCVYVSVLKKYILTSVTTEMIRKKINQVNFYTNMTLNMFDKTFKIGISVQCI